MLLANLVLVKYKELEDLRNEIKDLTEKIVELAGKRIVIAKRIGVLKKSKSLTLRDPKIENELKKTVIETCRKNSINIDFGLRLLKLLINESIREERFTLEKDES